MALNFSHRPIFPPHLPEENLVQGGSQERDIRELLPADPFGMDISSTVTALTGWLEDLGADYGGYGGPEVGDDRRDYSVYGDWSFWWDTAATMELQTFPGYRQFSDRVPRDVGVSSAGFLPKQESGCSRYGCGGFQFCCSMNGARFGAYDNVRENFDQFGNNRWDFDFRLFNEELDRCPVYNRGVPFAPVSDGANFGLVNNGFVGNHGMNVVVFDDRNGSGNQGKVLGDGNDKGNYLAKVFDDGNVKCNHNFIDDDDGIPHTAIKYAFPYLGVRDLLAIEIVCKSFRQTVRSELLFTDIHIDQSLNDRITDDSLFELTKKACGELHCLSLVACQRITDDGLRRVLDANPKLVKLSVPGCTRLSIDGIVNSVRAFQTVAVTGIRCLRVGGIYGVTETHFEELVSLLGIGNNNVQVNHNKPHFFFGGNVYLSRDDDRPIDIEMCPRCQNLRLVYDCPAERCQSSEAAAQLCRACTHCIPRCAACGKCINGAYTETFTFEVCCSDCSKEYKETSPCEHDFFQEEPVFSLHG